MREAIKRVPLVILSKEVCNMGDLFARGEFTIHDFTYILRFITSKSTLLLLFLSFIDMYRVAKRRESHWMVQSHLEFNEQGATFPSCFKLHAVNKYPFLTEYLVL